MLTYLNDENVTSALVDKNAPGFLTSILSRRKYAQATRPDNAHADLMYEQLFTRLTRNNRHIQIRLDETRILMDAIWRDSFLFGIATAFNLCVTVSDQDAVFKHLMEESNKLFRFSMPLVHTGGVAGNIYLFIIY